MIQTEAWKVLLHWSLPSLASGKTSTTMWTSLGPLLENENKERDLNHPGHLTWDPRHVNEAVLDHPAWPEQTPSQPIESWEITNVCCFQSLSFGVVYYISQRTINSEPGSLQMCHRYRYSLSHSYFFFFFWPRHMACGILVPRPGIKPRVLTTGPPGNSLLLLLFLEDLCSVSHQRFKLKGESLIEKCEAMARGSGVFLRPLKQLHTGDSGFPVTCSHRMM